MTKMQVLIVYDERVTARTVLDKLKEALGEKYTVKVDRVENCHVHDNCSLCNPTIDPYLLSPDIDPYTLAKHRKLLNHE